MQKANRSTKNFDYSLVSNKKFSQYIPSSAGVGDLQPTKQNLLARRPITHYSNCMACLVVLYFFVNTLSAGVQYIRTSISA